MIKTMRFHITKILEVRPCVGIVSTSAVPACSNWRTPWHWLKFMAFFRALIKARHAARKSWSSEREMILALRATQERRGFKHMFGLCFKVPNVGLNAFQHKHLWVANHKPGNQVGILILLFDFVLLWEPLNNESYRYTIFEYFRCVSLSTALCRTVDKQYWQAFQRSLCAPLPGILACVCLYPLYFVLNFSESGPSPTLSLALHPPGTLPQQCLESQWQAALDNPKASAEWILDKKHQKSTMTQENALDIASFWIIFINKITACGRVPGWLFPWLNSDDHLERGAKKRCRYRIMYICTSTLI